MPTEVDFKIEKHKLGMINYLGVKDTLVHE